MTPAGGSAHISVVLRGGEWHAPRRHCQGQQIPTLAYPAIANQEVVLAYFTYTQQLGSDVRQRYTNIRECKWDSTPAILCAITSPSTNPTKLVIAFVRTGLVLSAYDHDENSWEGMNTVRCQSGWHNAQVPAGFGNQRYGRMSIQHDQPPHSTFNKTERCT